MIYITGDTHGDFDRVSRFCERHSDLDLTKSDMMIVLGDAGLNYYSGWEAYNMKKKAEALPLSFLCVHGNHEQRPEAMSTYHEKEWMGGRVYVQDNFPSIMFAKDGEVYTVGEATIMPIGGAYSVDKWYRLERYNEGVTNSKWFPNEQPCAEIKSRVEKALEQRKNKVDVIISHTCPSKYVPHESLKSDASEKEWGPIDRSMEEWLDKIEDMTEYKKWYCGHWHIEKVIDNMRFMYEDIAEFTA